MLLDGKNSASQDSGDTLQDPVRTIKAVGDRTRLQILKVLLKEEHCVTDIARQLGLAQPRISHHLTILRNSGLVMDRRNGKQIIYSVNPDFRSNQNGNGAGIRIDCVQVDFGAL